MSKHIVEWFFSNTGKRDFILVGVIIILSALMLFIPTGFENRIDKNVVHVKAIVEDVDNSDVQLYGLIRSGTQLLRIRILEGRFQDQELDAVNNLIGKLELDAYYKPGDVILADLSLNREGEVVYVNPSDHYRINIEIVLVGLFALLLVILGGFTGFKALLSFIFTALVIWKILLPKFLEGVDPVLTALAVVTVLNGVIIFLVGGFNKKGLSAFLGAIMGLAFTCFVSIFFAEPFHIHGAVKPFSETLLYSGFAHLDLTRIFLAGIFVASSGAVMDLAMDISSAIHEIVEHNPDISAVKLFKSAITIGKSVIGTMTTTLLLAYSASYLNMMMVFMGQGIPMINILNMNYVAAEILNTIVGSFGLIMVAPFTALSGSFLYAGRMFRSDHADSSKESGHNEVL